MWYAARARKVLLQETVGLIVEGADQSHELVAVACKELTGEIDLSELFLNNIFQVSFTSPWAPVHHLR